MTFDEAHVAMGAIAQWYDEAGPENRNEATTRLHLIDRLLFEALGWNRADCVAEDHLDHEYTDYSLGSPAKVLVVEAKREGRYFLLPAGSTNTTARIQSLIGGNPELEAAITQAAGYCMSRGISIGAVSNGHQLVAFLGSRTDGVPPLKGRAAIFPSLSEMNTHFLEFWNCLSPEGIEQGQLEGFIAGPTNPPPPPKLSRQLRDYPGSQRRNDLQTDLSILGEVFLQDLIGEPEFEESFLQECYCSSGALSQYALVSKEILRSRYAAIAAEKSLDISPARDKSAVSPQLMEVALSRSITRRPILLVGDVGVGKSTFLEHLIKIDAKEELGGSIVLKLDFGASPALRTDIEGYVVDVIERELRLTFGVDILEDSFVRGVYHGEIQRFRQGIWKGLIESDPSAFQQRELEYLQSLLNIRESHLKASLDHLNQGRLQEIVIFLDNVDQRDHQFQEAVFLIAQTMADSWPVTVFVCLRPSTFNVSRRTGSLSAYQPRVFTISPPRINEVLLKRLKYAHRLLMDHGVHLPTVGISLDSALLTDYIGVLIDSLETSHPLVECLDNMSGGNVREALRLLTIFIGSGHVNTKKILGVLEETGRYTIAFHEFLRAIVFGENFYYDPESSPAANVFDISSPDGREHFLTLGLLNYIQSVSESRVGDSGFISIAESYEYGQGCGFDRSQIEEALNRAISKGLVESTLSDNAHYSGVRVRITQVGSYTSQRLVDTFVYLDAVVVDTPIVERECRSNLKDARTIDDRIERVESFVSYLDAQWTAGGQGIAGVEWNLHSDAIREDIVRIGASIARGNRRVR